MTNLKILDLSHNQISYLHANIFDSASSIKVDHWLKPQCLNISHNKLSSDSFLRCLYKLENLDRLDVSANEIYHLNVYKLMKYLKGNTAKNLQHLFLKQIGQSHSEVMGLKDDDIRSLFPQLVCWDFKKFAPPEKKTSQKAENIEEKSGEKVTGEGFGKMKDVVQKKDWSGIKRKYKKSSANVLKDITNLAGTPGQIETRDKSFKANKSFRNGNSYANIYSNQVSAFRASSPMSRSPNPRKTAESTLGVTSKSFHKQSLSKLTPKSISKAKKANFFSNPFLEPSENSSKKLAKNSAQTGSFQNPFCQSNPKRTSLKAPLSKSPRGSLNICARVKKGPESVFLEDIPQKVLPSQDVSELSV